MATTNNITSTFVGKDSKEFISPILTAGVTLGTPNVTIKSNVNYKSRITKIALSGLIKDATCDFDPTGTIDQTELWLNVKLLEVNLSLCKNDYYADFIGEDMGTNGDLPAAFLSYLVGEIGSNVADAIETMVWQGAAGANSFAGYETLLDTIDVTGTTASSSTIIAEVRKMTALANKDVLASSDTLLYVSSESLQALKEAFNDKNSASPCGENCLSVDGIKIAYAPGLSASSMVLAQKSNLFFGTWASSDLQSIAVRDMSDLLEDNIRFAMKFFAGAAIGYRNEIVYYS